MKFKLTRGTINSFYNDSSIFSFLESHLNDLSGTVLDIGCGRMRYKKTILSGQKVTAYLGLDLEEGKFTYNSVADLYWDGITMPLGDNSIDSAILFEVLEHCPNPSIVLKETFRVLKPNGTLLVSTPFLYQLHGTPHDFNRFTPWALEKTLRDIGFTEINLLPSGSWDASLGQMISIWITHRPMPRIIRKILSILFVPFFKILIFIDQKNRTHRTKNKKSAWSENDIMPGILGVIKKPS